MYLERPRAAAAGGGGLELKHSTALFFSVLFFPSLKVLLRRALSQMALAKVDHTA